jgi:hypothetical protein
MSCSAKQALQGVALQGMAIQDQWVLRVILDTIKARQVASVHEVEKVSSRLKQCILPRAETLSCVSHCSPVA